MISDGFRRRCSGLLALYFVGLGLYVTGFATDYWYNRTNEHGGLWRECFLQTTDSTWTCNRMDIAFYESWMKSVVAFMILGLLFAVFGGVIYMFVPLSASCQMFSGVCTLIGVAVYAGYQTTKILLLTSELYWSFALTTAGGACLLVNGITLISLLSKEEGGITMEKIMPKAESPKIGTTDYDMYYKHYQQQQMRELARQEYSRPKREYPPKTLLDEDYQQRLPRPPHTDYYYRNKHKDYSSYHENPDYPGSVNADDHFPRTEPKISDIHDYQHNEPHYQPQSRDYYADKNKDYYQRPQLILPKS